MRARLAAINLAALLCLLACYDTPAPPCAFSCARNGECPDGYACRSDNWCKRADLADDFTCLPRLTPDAAPVPDASVDPPDAAPFDASPPDASTPDAMSISGD